MGGAKLKLLFLFTFVYFWCRRQKLFWQTFECTTSWKRMQATKDLPIELLLIRCCLHPRNVEMFGHPALLTFLLEGVTAKLTSTNHIAPFEGRKPIQIVVNSQWYWSPCEYISMKIVSCCLRVIRPPILRRSHFSTFAGSTTYDNLEEKSKHLEILKGGHFMRLQYRLFEFLQLYLSKGAWLHCWDSLIYQQVLSDGSQERKSEGLDIWNENNFWNGYVGFVLNVEYLFALTSRYASWRFLHWGVPSYLKSGTC